MKQALIASILLITTSLAGCAPPEDCAVGTVESVQELALDEPSEAAKHYDDLLEPEPAEQVIVRTDDGKEVVLMHEGSRHYERGQRVCIFDGFKRNTSVQRGNRGDTAAAQHRITSTAT